MARIPAARERKLREEAKRKISSLCVNTFNLTAARISDHPTGIFVQFDMTYNEYLNNIEPLLPKVEATLNEYRPVGGTRSNPVYSYVLYFEIPELAEDDDV